MTTPTQVPSEARAPWQLSALELASLVQRRELSPVEIVESCIERIEEVNPLLCAVVATRYPQARAEARLAEQRAAAGERAPLLGVPCTIKEFLAVEGMPHTGGILARRAVRAERDATVVARLKAAGAIVLGVTNAPEGGLWPETNNPVYGRTHNPHDVSRTCGGSSGGEAALLAVGGAPFGLGSDAGGSIRIPAHFSGITGLKPTPGRVSAAGHFPEIAHPGGLLGVAGPMARNVADLRLLFEVLSGHDPEDPFSAPVPLRTTGLEGVRVGLMENWNNVPVQPEMREAVLRAGKLLEECGIPVEPFRPHGVERATEVWSFFFIDVPAAFTREMIAGRESECHSSGLELLRRTEGRPEPTGREVVTQLAIRDKMRASLLRQMEKFPILLLPACGVAAWRHGERRWKTPQGEIELLEAMAPVTPFNLFGMPGLVVPITFTSDTLPIGVQLVGAPWTEELLLEVGARLEAARGPFAAPPEYLS